MPERQPAPQLSDYSHRFTDNIRFADVDAQGHVNNVIFATFIETGRVTISRDPEQGFQVPGAGFALRKLTIDYLAEMKWPGQVTIATRIRRIGKSSLTLAHGLFVGNTCTATAESVMVLVDGKTRRPCPFPDDIAAKLRNAAEIKD